MAIVPTLGLLRSELFPTEIRATASGIISASANLTWMVNNKLFPMAVASFGFHSVVYFYAAMTGVMAAWGLLTMKNTDQLSLTEIQDMQQKTESVGKSSSSSDKEVNSGTDVENSSDEKVEKTKEGRGDLALSSLSKRNCYVSFIKMNEAGCSTAQNEMENNEDQDKSTICDAGATKIHYEIAHL